MNNPANYDFAVYGASGFTGKLVVEYALNQYSNEDISWAIAGRNLEKLQNLKEKLKLTNDVGIIQVDSEDQSSIDALVHANKMCFNNCWAISALWRQGCKSMHIFRYRLC